MKVSAHGGMRLGEFWGTWPTARLSFTPTEIQIDFFGRHAVAKEDVQNVVFRRGSFTCDIRIYHQCDWSEEPIQFFGFGHLRAIERFAHESGYPCDVGKRPFYEKGDITLID